MSSDSGSHHIVPLATYAKVISVLLVLTVLTVAVAKPVTGVDFGFLNTFIAMLIATVKASLVLAIFMHLKYDNKLNLMVFLTGVFFLLVLFAFTYTDIVSRIPVFSTM
ncbi:MAG: cytochrome C oxidase subunit IV family protein [Pseudobdellovibrionaceae bacterium]|nr:cytochrome C oxidase subunit IV family protein [Bdellovibrionales bacterium]USN46632.1 MAG: cytochrome C oxidase subunit IV family protein [Pseudobdellovibrionaceae bacterium]